MTLDRLNRRGLVLLGCGKMGSALLAGWLQGGIKPAAVFVLDPQPSDWVAGLAREGLHLNQDLPKTAAICVVAVKPQMMAAALPLLQALGGGSTVFLSIAAGTPIRALEALLGGATPIIRAMPNTPAAVGHAITALVANNRVDEAALVMAETLLRAVGQTVRLDDETQMDAVTAVSGSGPAYVFNLIEALADAGKAEGLPAELALKLALVTVAGAGDLAEKSNESPANLRRNVTSPGGTTAAALQILMDQDSGFSALLKKAVNAAANRSRELGASA